MRYPGEVHFLPPEARDEGDLKWRRHVLLNTCEAHGDIGVFSYATRSRVEIGFGGAGYLVDPVRGPDRDSGFSAPTYVTPCRLAPVKTESLSQRIGKITHAMPAIRGQVRRAVGATAGTPSGEDSAGSLRGLVVELSSGLARENGTPYAVIVSDPAYSRAQRYQLILPLGNAAEFEAEQFDIVITDRDWPRFVSRDLSVVLLFTKHIQSAFHRSDIARVLPVAVDPQTMREIDLALVRLFSL
jgi:hypothetical protein